MSSSLTPLTNTRHWWVWSSGASGGLFAGSKGCASLPKTTSLIVRKGGKRSRVNKIACLHKLFYIPNGLNIEIPCDNKLAL